MGLIDGLINLVIRGVLESGKAPALNRMVDNTVEKRDRMQNDCDRYYRYVQGKSDDELKREFKDSTNNVKKAAIGKELKNRGY